MEIKTVILPAAKKAEDPTVIYFLGDIHEGAANMDRDAFKQAVETIRSEGAYWIGMGDYVDCINHHDKRFNALEIAQTYKISDLNDLPRKQADRVLSATKPIWDKCLGLLSGNHEDKYAQRGTFDVVSYMAGIIGCDNLQQKAWINLAFGRGDNLKGVRNCYKIVVCHGIGGGGMREGYPVNKTYDVFRYTHGDVHVQGHLHRMTDDRASFETIANGKISYRPAYYATNGCFLRKSDVGNSGYFEQRPGKNSDIGMIKLSIKTFSRKREEDVVNLSKIYLGT